MHLYYFNRKRVLIGVFSLLTLLSHAQNTNQISFLDKESALPISGATFNYGTQDGITDNMGTVFFTYVENQTMTLSHVNYGQWQLVDEEVKNALQQKVSYRQAITLNLYPVTVIAVRPNQAQSENLVLQFQDKMAHDGAEILTQSPAVNGIRKSGAYGLDPVFRGYKYDQLNIVMNGAQTASAACPNRMDPPTSQMAPNMMDRIDVLKGPHALRFGTGLGATINFIPSRLRFTENPGIYGRVSGGYETNGEAIRSEALLGYNNEKIDLGVFGAYSQGNDYTSGNDDTVAAGYTRSSIGLNLGVKLNSNQQLRISGMYNIARDVDFAALPMDLRTDDTYMLNARHDIALNKGQLKSWNTTAYVSYVDHTMDNYDKVLSPRKADAITNATTLNYGGRTEGHWRFDKSTLYAGLDFRHEEADGTRERTFLMGPNTGKTVYDNVWQDSHINKTGLFGEYQINTKSIQYIFSGRVEFNQAGLNESSEDFMMVNSETEINHINPSFSAGALYTLKENMKVGLWLGRAQRSGGLAELFINYFPIGNDPYEIVGNTELEPEVNNQVDLTYSWNTEKTALNIDVFASYLQNAITSVIDTSLDPQVPTSPGVRRTTNIDEAFRTGFEINWTQLLFAGISHQFGVAYTYAQDLERNQPLPEIAPMDIRYSLKGSYLKHRLKPEINLRYVVEQDRISEEYGETVTPAFFLMDLRLSYQIIPSLSISLDANNLLNANYYEHLNRSVRGTKNPIYARGTNILLAINYTF